MSSKTPREQAAAWLMRFNEGAISLEDELELELWLDENPAHREALSQAATAWRAAGEAAERPELIAARADALQALRDANRRRWRFRLPARRFALAAFAACLALMIAAVLYLYPSVETYRTAIGERRVIALADGSRLSLDAASTVEVRYDGERRALRLIAGRARFDVAKDPRRPFTVMARNRMIVATGTAFSVELLGQDTRVVLYRGSVALLEDGPADQVPRHVMLQGSGRIPVDHLLRPNMAVVVSDAASAPGKLETVDAARTLSWEQGQLIFSDEPLGVAVERVNRYSAAKLAIDDPAVAALPVSGAFNAGDTDGFVEGVSALYGLRKQRRGAVTVLKAAAP